MNIRSQFSGLSLRGTERQKIISDIIHLKADRKLAADERYRDDEFQDDAERLERYDTPELIDHWLETVGQWVIERDDCHPPTGCDYEDYLTVQLGKVIDGQETDYGFIASVTIPETRNN